MSSAEDYLRNTLNWRKLEAQCYCALVRYGEMKASTVASHTSTRPEKVYQPLNNLVSNGYAILTNSNPKTFKAQNPTYVVGEEREEFERHADVILQDLQEGWERTLEGVPETGDHARVASGKDGMKTEQGRIISNAEESIWAFDTRFQLTSPKVIEEIEDCIDRGLDVRLLTTEGAEHDVSFLHDQGAKTGIIDEPTSSSFYVVDGSEVLMNVSRRRATVVFEDEYFADIMREQFEDMFQQLDSSKS